MNKTSLLLAAALVLVAGCGSSLSPEPTTTAVAPRPEVTLPGQTASRPFDESVAGQPVEPSPEDLGVKIQPPPGSTPAETPAASHLPFEGDGIRAEVLDKDPSGQLVVLVTGSGSTAEGTWLRFLDRYDDPGDGYIVFYRGA